ncbi:MAG: response regulator transcription factor, partial [Ruminococcaceae bacterium]|nr:response regulator transcription factor [Oscillospiraceae bacterium]
MSIRTKVILADDLCPCFDVKELSRCGCDVIVAATNKETVELSASHCPDLILINHDAPDIDARELLELLRSRSDIPVIVLCSDIPMCGEAMLSSGMVDFIVSPFNVSELQMRIRFMLRYHLICSTCGETREGRLSVGEILVDYDKHCVMLNGSDAGLTLNEYKMVALLAKNKDVVIPYEDILRELWGPNWSGDKQVLRVHMSNIRRKLETNTSFPDRK